MTGNEKRLRERRFAVICAAAAVFAFGAGGGALAAGSGGGGALPSSSAGPRIDPAQSYQDGVAALEAGDYKTAEQKFGEVLSVARDHPEANYYMGVAKVGRGKDKSSVRYFKRAIKEREGFIEAREQLALVYVKIEKPEDASEQLDALKAIKENCASETCDDAYMNRIDRAIERVEAALAGGGSEEVSDAVGALREYALLSTASPEGGVERYNEAVRLINQERYAEAAAALVEAQRAYGPHPDILNYLGFSLRKSGDFDAAQSYYAMALRIDPDHRGATEYLGELYLELGDVAKARAQLARLDHICVFACPEREDLARLIAIRDGVRNARR